MEDMGVYSHLAASYMAGDKTADIYTKQPTNFNKSTGYRQPGIENRGVNTRNIVHRPIDGWIRATSDAEFQRIRGEFNV